jgi:Tfp pilus assembly protein PilF
LNSLVAQWDNYHHLHHFLASRTHLHYAESLIGVGDNQAAMVQLEQAIFQEHQNPHALGRKAELVAAETPEAMTTPKLYNYVEELFTSDENLRIRMGFTVTEASRIAERNIEKAIMMEPEWGNFHRMLGEKYLLEGNFSKACECFQQAILHIAKAHDIYHRKASNVHVRRGIHFMRDNQPELARMDFLKSLDLNRNNRFAKRLLLG